MNGARLFNHEEPVGLAGHRSDGKWLIKSDSGEGGLGGVAEGLRGLGECERGVGDAGDLSRGGEGERQKRQGGQDETHPVRKAVFA